MTPAPMKHSVATIDLAERRDRPQIPCPLVQPLPSRVPNPTINPAIMITGQDAVTMLWALRDEMASMTVGAMIMLAMKASFSIRSDVGVLLASMLPRMPLTPAIRPLSKK